jgi:hypothetical protein
MRWDFRYVYGTFNFKKRHLAILAQFHTTYAKYYSAKESRNLLEEAGFIYTAVLNRVGYSWTVSVTKLVAVSPGAAALEKVFTPVVLLKPDFCSGEASPW